MFDKYLMYTCPKLMSGERQILLCVQSFIVIIVFILFTSVSIAISLPGLCTAISSSGLHNESFSSSCSLTDLLKGPLFKYDHIGGWSPTYDCE